MIKEVEYGMFTDERSKHPAWARLSESVNLPGAQGIKMRLSVFKLFKENALERI